MRAEKTVKKNGGSAACLFSNTINKANFKYVEASDLKEAERRIPDLVKVSSATIEFPIPVEHIKPIHRRTVKRTINDNDIDLSRLSEKERKALRLQAEDSLAVFKGKFGSESFEAAVKMRMASLAVSQCPLDQQ